MDAEKHLGSLQGFLAVGLNPQCPPPLHDASQGWLSICNDQQLLPPFFPQTRLGEAKEAGTFLSPWSNAKYLCGYLSAQTWSLSTPHPSQLQSFNRELTSPQPSCRRAGPYPTLDCVLSFWRVPQSGCSAGKDTCPLRGHPRVLIPPDAIISTSTTS